MVGLLSDVGNIRTLNEDYLDYIEDETFRVYVIADGMGGHNAGEIASKLAVESVLSYLKENMDLENINDTLRDAVIYSNEQVYKFSKTSDDLSGMGTTITACLVKGNAMAVANVGDSSCFIIKKDGIEKVTKDHSLVQQLLDNGSITLEQAKDHPNKNIMTRALGTNSKVEVDIYDLSMEGVLKVVLATDGLTNDVLWDELFEIVSNNDNEVSCKKLIELCKYRGGRDNISVIVFKGECKDDRYFTGE